MTPNKIKEETEDRIVLIDNLIYNVLGGLFLMALVLIPLLFGDNDIDFKSYGIFMGLVIVFGVLFFVCLFFYGLYLLLVSESVIIDRQLRIIVIKKLLFVKYLISLKKIRFNDIIVLRITTHFLDERVSHTVATLVMSKYVNTDIYRGNLETTERQAGCINNGNLLVDIYYGNPETIERLGKNIKDITGSGISYRECYDTSTPMGG